MDRWRCIEAAKMKLQALDVKVKIQINCVHFYLVCVISTVELSHFEPIDIESLQV